jgi:hypothetical protein
MTSSSVNLQIGGVAYEFAWINSRGRSLDIDTLLKALTVLEAAGVDISQLETVPQPDTCEYNHPGGMLL